MLIVVNRENYGDNLVVFGEKAHMMFFVDNSGPLLYLVSIELTCMCFFFLFNNFFFLGLGLWLKR